MGMTQQALFAQAAGSHLAPTQSDLLSTDAGALAPSFSQGSGVF